MRKQECIFALSINNKLVHHFVCTNEHLEYLALGYVLSKGMVKKEDIISVDIDEKMYHININARDYQDGWNLYHEQIRMLEVKPQQLDTININDKGIEDKMYGIHEKGYHTAMLLVGDREYIDIDVSRHCAIDKVIGQAGDCKDAIIVTSGRISLEMVMKAKTVNARGIATLKYPTKEALEFAHKMGIMCGEINK